MKKLIFFFVLAVLLLNLSSALLIKSVDAPKFRPGEERRVVIEIENNLNTDAEDVALFLDFSGLPFYSVIDSSDSVDIIRENDEERFTFRVKASSSARAGDYAIPYTLSAGLPDSTQKGTISLGISSDPDLKFSAEAEIPVAGEKTKVTLRIVNKGLGDAKFLSLKISSSGFTILSEPDSYIGTIASDDFETTSFDALINSKNTAMQVLVEYRNTDNEVIQDNVVVPMNIYSKEKALQLGLISRSKIPIYLATAVTIILLWFLYRTIKKRRMKRSLQER